MSTQLDLVVFEEHALFAESLAFVLGEHGMLVCSVVDSPGRAVSEVLELRPRLCLMGLHFSAGDQDGIDAAGLIREQSPDTTVVLLVGPADTAVVPRALTAGVGGIAHTQQTVERLLDVILRAAAGEIAVDPQCVLWASGQAGGDDGTGRLSVLTPREREVLALLADGAGTEQVAVAMSVTRSTARTHVQNLLVKLGVHSRLEAVAYATRHDLLGSSPLAREPLARPVVPRQPSAVDPLLQRR